MHCKYFLKSCSGEGVITVLIWLIAVLIVGSSIGLSLAVEVSNIEQNTRINVQVID